MKPSKCKLVTMPDEEREAFVRSLVGKEEFQLVGAVSSLGALIQVASENGESLANTSDFRTDRVTVDLVGGKVVNAWIG